MDRNPQQPDSSTEPNAPMPIKQGLGGLIVAWLFAIIGIVTVLALTLGLDPNSGKTNDTLIFLGRFHPLIVHFPIALLIMVALLEWGSLLLKRPHWRIAVAPILVFAALGAVFSVVHGTLLVAGNGQMSATTEQHLWAGAAFTILVLLLVPIRCMLSRSKHKAAGIPYHAGLILALPTLMVASHLGGNLTHGPDYLVAYMPEPLKHSLASLPSPLPEFIGLPIGKLTDTLEASSQTREISLYQALFQAPLEKHCVSCHNPGKIRGGLLMHTLEKLMEGGESGPAIQLGNLDKSELYQRITLDRDDPYFMPPDGKPPLPDATVSQLKWWIESGLPGETSISAIEDAPEVVLQALQPLRTANSGPPPSAPVDFDGWNEHQLNTINAQIPGRILPLSRQAKDGLSLITAGVGADFDDQALATIAPLANSLREADLGRTQITDSGLQHLAKWQNLRSLKLDHTRIDGTGLQHLEALAHLETLNLYQTELSGQGLNSIAKIPNLRQLYLSPSTHQALAANSIEGVDPISAQKLISLLPSNHHE